MSQIELQKAKEDVERSTQALATALSELRQQVERGTQNANRLLHAAFAPKRLAVAAIISGGLIGLALGLRSRVNNRRRAIALPQPKSSMRFS